MFDFHGRAILLDIEGTTSSVSFVFDVMFPFVRRELEGYLDRHWGQPELVAACDVMARDAGHRSLSAWCGEQAGASACRQCVRDEVLRLMAGDVKATGLKQLQGLIWQAGFESGELRAHVYDDVLPALTAWKAQGLDIRIYSSGSIAAQKLFFGHTIVGDLRSYFSGHYDTTTGPKREAASYRAIGLDMQTVPSEILFVSDVLAELDAARAAGMITTLSLRPGNAEITTAHRHPAVTSFAQIQVVDSGG